MSLPIFPLNTVLFPGVPMPLRIFEERYLRMLSERATIDPAFGIALIAAGREVGDRPAYHQVGTTARLVSLNAQSPQLIDIVVIGGHRIRVQAGNWTRGYAMAEVEEAPDDAYDPEVAAATLDRAKRSYVHFVRAIARVLSLPYEAPALNDDPRAVSFAIASRLPLHTWEQQALLEDSDPLSRLQTVCTLLDRELALLYRGGVAGMPLPTPGDRFTLN